MKNVVLYTRVSTDEQAEKGYSLNAQKDSLEKFCATKGWNILKIFKEDFSAWKGFDRPAYKELREFIDSKRFKVDYVLCTQWSRFSREQTAAFVEYRELKRKGIEVNATEQWIDLTVPENRYTFAFYLTAPQVENDRLSLRTIAGMRQGMKQGRWLWRGPSGYKNDRSNKVLLIDEKVAPMVKFAFEKFAMGIYSIEEVRRMAAEKGLRLCKQAFINLLRNPLYEGKIFLKAYKDEPSQMIRGIHEPLISELLFDEVQQILQGKKKPYKGISKNEDFPLLGHLICPRCGKLLTASASKGRSKYYGYYHCQRKYGCSVNISSENLNNKFVQFLWDMQPSPESIELYELILADVFKTKDEQRETEMQQLKHEINETDKKITSLEEKYISDKVSSDVYQKHQIRLESEKNDLSTKYNTLFRLPSEFEQYLKFGMSFIRNLRSNYIASPTSTKRKIIGSIFPEKLHIHGDSYRTDKINEVFALISKPDAVLKKKKPSKKTGPSIWAPQTGLEPVTL